MISVTILTKNSERYLKEVLEALLPFDEVVIYDNGSKDDTLNIAAEFPNVTIHEGRFYGFGQTHNVASSLAKHDWIFSVDSDEIVSRELADEILGLSLDPHNVYSMLRQNEYRGKWIKGCGWHPDWILRIYNRKATEFSAHKVHEKIILNNMKEVRLKGPLRHKSYESIHEFLSKMQHYSDLFVNEKQGKVRSSPFKACAHGFWTFFRSYFLKKGFLDGYEGYIISKYNAHTAFYKYMKLYEADRYK